MHLRVQLEGHHAKQGAAQSSIPPCKVRPASSPRTHRPLLRTQSSMFGES